MKKCSLCGIEKPYSEFHKKEKSPGGVRADCKACHCAARRQKNSTPEARARKAAYQKSPAGQAAREKYRQSEKGKAKTREYINRKYAESPEFREKKKVWVKSWRKSENGRAHRRAEGRRMIESGRMRVYQTLHSALRNGSITRQPCEVCGEAEAQAHHDDYSKPLDVRWLCVFHHAEHHRRHA